MQSVYMCNVLHRITTMSVILNFLLFILELFSFCISFFLSFGCCCLFAIFHKIFWYIVVGVFVLFLSFFHSMESVLMSTLRHTHTNTHGKIWNIFAVNWNPCVPSKYIRIIAKYGIGWAKCGSKNPKKILCQNRFIDPHFQCIWNAVCILM